MDLPSYTEASLHAAAGSGSDAIQAGSQHTVSLRDGKGSNWLTLSVRSRSPTSTSLPIFYEGDVISGQVDLNVLHSESIKGISIRIVAGTTLIGQDEQLFLNTETDLWTPSASLSDGSKAAKFTKGKYMWPFSLMLQAKIDVQDPKTRQTVTFALPTSFSERASTVYVDYKLIVTVKRGMLRVDNTLMTAFSYVPVTRPGLPSPMLQKTYKEGHRLVGPKGDPDGWHSLPPVAIQGTLFDSRPAQVTLSLSLAKPLAYGRGSVIPLWLTLAGDDEQALDLLSSPKEIKLLLVRSLATGSNATTDADHRTDNCFSENVARAVFWVPRGYRDVGQRVLPGEVDIKTILKPSTLFPRFTISYHLDLRQFEAAGFVVTTPKGTSLLRQRVTIVNFPALGMPLRSRAPPEYVQGQGTDYNRSVGLLENGNRRFLHHGGGGA